jgi:hypothetical protein
MGKVHFVGENGLDIVPAGGKGCGKYGCGKKLKCS